MNDFSFFFSFWWFVAEQEKPFLRNFYRNMLSEQLQSNPYPGAGGAPRATPYTTHYLLNMIMRPSFFEFFSGSRLCKVKDMDVTWERGPHLPAHWLDWGSAVYFKYYTDAVPYDAHKFFCQLPDKANPGQRCNYTPQIEERNIKFCYVLKEPDMGNPFHDMVRHVASVHQTTEKIDFSVQPNKEWSTGLFECDGFLDIWCCFPCMMTRMIRAFTGHRDSFDQKLCCVGLCCMQLRVFELTGSLYCVAPHVNFNLKMRHAVSQLQRIDEDWMKTCAISFCCPLCSAAQVWRELRAVGLHPGGYITGKYQGDAPANADMK